MMLRRSHLPPERARILSRCGQKWDVARKRSSTMPQATYQGSCHCGNVRYSVDADLSGEMLTCNCSICQRTGSALAFVPAPQFKLERGDDALTDYQFGKKRIHHLFCKTCGIRSFA